MLHWKFLRRKILWKELQYHIAGNFGGELNLAVWWSTLATAKLLSTIYLNTEFILRTSVLTLFHHTTYMYIGATFIGSCSNAVVSEHASSWPSSSYWWTGGRPAGQGANQHRGLREFDELPPTSNHDPSTPLSTAALWKPQYNVTGVCVCVYERERERERCVYVRERERERERERGGREGERECWKRGDKARQK